VPAGGSSGGGGNNDGNTGVDPDLPTYPIGGGGGETGGGSGGSTSAFNLEFLGNLTQNQINWLNDNPTILSQIYNYLQIHGQPDNENGWYDNYQVVQCAIQLTTFLVQENGIKDNLRQAIANGITTTA